MTTTTDPRPRCRKCRHVLRSAKSIKLGYGPTCARRIKENARIAATDYKPQQVEKAMELIELGAIVATVHALLFEVVSSSGTERYLTDAAARACTCKAGERGVRCYHLAAAQILTAA
jgi:hypothetical protein